MVAQPTGTLTLVFTDIEGSTLLLDGLGRERYSEALAEHRRGIREAFGRHRGYEVDNAGDGFFYAFSTAAEAARAVSEALDGLDGGAIQVRVGLHTGEPLVDPPKYVGLDVHRAARIMAAAHGGQALMSRTTRELLDGSFTVRDLGDHRLKDLSAAQRLFQLGPGEFPRPRTLRRTNLPVPATEFVGRARELDDVIDRLRSGVRLLTLTGPGGTGKTRLSLQAAAGAADDFDDGVWWVPLAPLRDPALVLRQTAHTLDVLEQPDRPLEEVLAEMLGGKRMLIVLDNAEHLLPAAAASIATLRDLDGPQLVVTSRERLQLAGEHVYPVPQLTTPEGLDLFTMRAAALDPRFQVSPAARELCGHLDNLPLAIELAAARTAVLRPEQILERLSGRLDLLKGGRDADPRQQTLRATIAWSYDLLVPDERELFARLAVFAGSASLEAVEVVCAADIETLASLVEKSLVRRDGERFWMLETIREFGVEQLDDEQQARLLEAHGAFYERFAREARAGLQGTEPAHWLGRIEEELPNLRAAMERALEGGLGRRSMCIAADLGRYWEARSGATEGRSWIERSLDSGPLPDAQRAIGCFWGGRLAFFQGALAAAEALLVDAAEAAKAAGAVAVEAFSVSLLVWVMEERGAGASARPATERSLELLAKLSDPWERSEVLLSLNAAPHAFGEPRAVGEEVLALKREAGDLIAISDSLNNLGWDDLLRGEFQCAIVSLEEAAAIARELGDTFRLSLAICNLGLTAALQERYPEAAELLRETVLLSIHRGDRRCGLEAVLGLAAAAAGLGNDELSVKLDKIQSTLMADAGIVYEPLMLDQLAPVLATARQRLTPEQVANLESEIRTPTLEQAIELLDEAQSL